MTEQPKILDVENKLQCALEFLNDLKDQTLFINSQNCQDNIQRNDSQLFNTTIVFESLIEIQISDIICDLLYKYKSPQKVLSLLESLLKDSPLDL
jgi:hypothetical protein